MGDKWERRFDNIAAVVCGVLVLIIVFGILQ